MVITSAHPKTLSSLPLRHLLRKSPVISSSRSGRRFEDYAVALPFEQLNSPAGDPLRVAAVVVVRARIAVGVPWARIW
jgi:hypothetical protein